MYPEKRLDIDKCPICDGKITPKYICRYCNQKLDMDEIKNYKCSNCGRPVPKEKVETGSSDQVIEAKRGSFNSVTMKGDEITIELEENEIVSLDGVEEVSLNFSETKVASIVNPDFAEFSTVKECEKIEDSANLYFQAFMDLESQEKKEILKKIQQMDWSDKE